MNGALKLVRTPMHKHGGQILYTAYHIPLDSSTHRREYSILYVYKKRFFPHACRLHVSAISDDSVVITREQAVRVLREWRALVRRRCLK